MLLGENLSYSHTGDRNREALVQIPEIRISAGELVGVIGPNGAGKSTLIKLLAGVLAPANGTFKVDDEQLPPGLLHQYIAYLPQHLEVHWPLRVSQVLGLASHAYAGSWYQRLLFTGTAETDGVDQWLQELDISHLAERSVDQLSGGELTRVLLARAVAQNAPYLLVDEPVNNLDPAHQFSIMQVLRAEAQNGAGVLAVLHDLSLVKRFCDQVVVLAQGRVVAQGTPDAVLNASLLTDVFAIKSSDVEHWLHKIG